MPRGDEQKRLSRQRSEIGMEVARPKKCLHPHPALSRRKSEGARWLFFYSLLKIDLIFAFPERGANAMKI